MLLYSKIFPFPENKGTCVPPLLMFRVLAAGGTKSFLASSTKSFIFSRKKVERVSLSFKLFCFCFWWTCLKVRTFIINVSYLLSAKDGTLTTTIEFVSNFVLKQNMFIILFWPIHLSSQCNVLKKRNVKYKTPLMSLYLRSFRSSLKSQPTPGCPDICRWK